MAGSEKDKAVEIVEKLPDGIVILNEEGKIQFTNPAACRLLGRSEEELLEFDFGSPSVEGEMAEVDIPRKDGGKTPVELRVEPVEWDGQNMRLVSLRDVSKRKQDEEDIAESRKTAQATLDALDANICVLDREGTIVSVNDSWHAFGKANDADPDKIAEGANYLAALESAQGEDRKTAQDFAEGIRDVMNGVRDSYAIEYPCHSPDEKRWFVGSVTPIKNSGKQLNRVVVAHRNVTGRKLAEEENEKLQTQFLHAQKMESVGRLAGGVAHDLNNTLGAIIGFSELALEKVDSGQPLFNYLQQVRKAADQSVNMTRQLLTFARKQTVAPKVIDLNEIVGGMLTMLRQLIGEDIGLVWTPGENISLINADPSQIEQILANLCVNARDAIEDVGEITIETDIVSVDNAYCADHVGSVPGEYVLLSVSDTGSGMDQETRSHVFEPFFTTKEQGKGTGLGLASVYGAVKQNNGFINVYSEPGQGTTFKLYLPLHKASTPFQADKATEKPTARGNETILLVEDDPSVLNMATDMLESLGYVVIAAETPGEGIRLANEHKGAFDLLMTDVVMPEMNGRDLAENLQASYPGIKCLFMSGYPASAIARHGVLEEGVHFIEKPFLLKDLGAKLRDVLVGKNADSTGASN